MQCPKCGYNNPDDALFCSLCHAVFRKESTKKMDVSPEEERYLIMHKHREGGSWKKWFAFDVWLSIIIIIGVAFWVDSSMKKREQTKTQMFETPTHSQINSEFSPPVDTSKWSIKKETAHFIIYCNNQILADDIATRVEGYYDIPIDLGLGEAGFWTKDKVNIYVYDTPQQYSSETGRDSWTSGYGEFKTRSIYSYKDANYLIEAIIPHELTHLIFADFMKFSNNYPKWLTEGLAMYEETKYCKSYTENYQNFLNQMRNGKYFSVDALTNIDLVGEKDIELIHFWYVESMSIVSYLIDTYGRGRIYTFCNSLKQNIEINKSLENAYAPDIKTFPELTDRWLNYIKTNQHSWEK